MTAFFKKYKRAILFWAIFLLLVLYVAPSQHAYYLDQDIQEFKHLYLIPALSWIFGLTAVGFFIVWFYKTKSVSQPIRWLLSTVVVFAFIIFIYQEVFLGIALLVNRQTTSGKSVKMYEASFLAGSDHSKRNFSLYDLSEKKISTDRKLINELYRADVKQNDTLLLSLNKGLFGVAFNPHKFED